MFESAQNMIFAGGIDKFPAGSEVTVTLQNDKRKLSVRRSHSSSGAAIGFERIRSVKLYDRLSGQTVYRMLALSYTPLHNPQGVNELIFNCYRSSLYASVLAASLSLSPDCQAKLQIASSPLPEDLLDIESAGWTTLYPSVYEQLGLSFLLIDDMQKNGF